MADECGDKAAEVGSPCSSDKENGSSSDSQTLPKDLLKPQNVDFDDYETMEELDFEDEKRECDVQKYVNVLQTSAQQNIKSESQNDASPKKNSSISAENGTDITSSEKSNMDKENCGESDMEEGETVDDGECVDIEDGEIDEMSKSEDLQKYSCRFFQRGKCIWGKECRYLHLSDKGLYNMFDSPIKRKKPPLQNTNYVSEPNFHYQPLPPPPPPPPPHPIVVEKHSENTWVKSPESMWDRALQEAKERIKLSKIRQDDYFEEDMHVKVGKEDRYVNKLNTSNYPPERPSPRLDSERIVRSVPDRSDLNRSERHIGRNMKGNQSRNTMNRKYTFNSEWNDPWRRSKTPPRHKRLRSKSSSDSSISSVSSHSSHSIRGGHDRSAKRFKACRDVRKRSQSRSRGRRGSPKRSHRSSSGSYRGSISSHSRSSSPKYRSRTDRYHSNRKSFRSPSSSPTYHKRKSSRSPDSIVLPYRRPSRSASPPSVHKGDSTKIESVENKREVSLKHSPSYRSRSRSCGSSKSPAPLVSPHSSRSHHSDMSISPISDSSLSRISSFSNQDSQSKNSLDTEEKTKTVKSKMSSRVNVPKSDDNIPRAYASPSRDQSFKNEPNHVSDIKVEIKAKKVLGLSAFQFMKYSAQKPGSKTQPLLSNVNVTTSSKKTDSVAKRSKDSSTKCDVPDKRLTKRDLLMQQLRAVEEAIARKKKSSCST